MVGQRHSWEEHPVSAPDPRTRSAILTQKTLLGQILPAALARTWEIIVSLQVAHPETSLSLPQVAAQAGRSLRTIQKNLAELEARGLVRDRVTRRIARSPDGTTQLRVVVVKDFTNLYALAEEYTAWQHAPEYVPPQRTCILLI